MAGNLGKGKPSEVSGHDFGDESLVEKSSRVPHDSDTAAAAAAAQEFENLQMQGTPVDTYRQRLEGQRIYQQQQGEQGTVVLPIPYGNKYVQIRPQLQQPEQQQLQSRYYDDMNYPHNMPPMYQEMRNVDVPPLTMMYCGVPNPSMNMANVGYAAPWDMRKFETNVPRRDRGDWSSRSSSAQSLDSKAFASDQNPRQNRKSKAFNSFQNKKSSKNTNGKSATDGMAIMPINGDLNVPSSTAAFEAALEESLLLERDDQLHRLNVTQESLESMVCIKEMSGSNASGVALFEKFESLSGESIVYLSREFSGSKIIQQCLDQQDESFAEMLYNKLKKYQKYLSVDTYGNYVIQHLLQSKSTKIQNELGLMLEENLLPLSLNFHGCRVVQMAIKHLPAEFCDKSCSKIAPVALHCLQSQHANHVVKGFFSLQGDRMPKAIVSIHAMICKNSEHTANHIYGFKVLQAALGSGISPELSKATIQSMEKKIISLSCAEYGNYLVQYFIETDIYNSREMAISCITNAPVLLMTCHKFGSNVIEKAIVHGSHDQKSIIIHRMVQECSLSGSIETALLHIASNKFGNYVLQRIFEVASLQDRELLAPHLRPHSRVLSSSVYGKHLIKYL